jgi:Ca-activated chloride channel family protein
MKVAPDCRVVPTQGDPRYVDFLIRADADRTPSEQERPPLRLGLVIDRSGSMSGIKLKTAKLAALQVLERLDERDQVSLVVFDDRIDVLLPLTPVSAGLVSNVRRALAGVRSRGSTALHEGWLTGCHSIAEDQAGPGSGRPSRVFLLTDGLANVGQTDPETIAFEAAQIYQRTGITTSTFGIGEDYDEGLLGPMAEAGSGQFHHLRHSHDILDTFTGELGALLQTAATNVTLELETGPEVEVDIVSGYWAEPLAQGIGKKVSIGDLAAGMDRHVIVRLRLPPGREKSVRGCRARLTWATQDGAKQGEWQEVLFTYATEEECRRAERDTDVLEMAGLHEAARARQEATIANRRGDMLRARSILQSASDTVMAFAPAVPGLGVEASELANEAHSMGAEPLPSMEAKEKVFRAQALRRGQRDYRRQPQDDDDDTPS